jgi:Fe-S-cluster containining protein
MNSPLPAGDFSTWLRAMRASLAGGPGMEVACGECVGCCTSSYFIKVRAGDTAALHHIPARHLAPAPDDPGTQLMGHDAAGHCPMFDGAGCSIYPHRPETCRTYDCRIFSAAGMEAGPGRTMINERIARWRFEFDGEESRREQRAVQAAANYLRQHPVRFPGGRIPSRPGDIAVLAVKSYTVFLGRDARDDAEAGAAIVQACHAFDQRSG